MTPVRTTLGTAGLDAFPVAQLKKVSYLVTSKFDKVSVVCIFWWLPVKILGKRAGCSLGNRREP